MSGLAYTGALTLSVVALITREIQPNTGPLFEGGILGTVFGFLLLYLAPKPDDGPRRWRVGRRCLKAALVLAMVGVWSTLSFMALEVLALGLAAALTIVGVVLVATAPTGTAATSEA